MSAAETVPGSSGSPLPTAHFLLSFRYSAHFGRSPGSACAWWLTLRVDAQLSEVFRCMFSFTLVGRCVGVDAGSSSPFCREPTAQPSIVSVAELVPVMFSRQLLTVIMLPFMLFWKM